MIVKMYTDGACSGNPGPGGWAVIVNTEKKCEKYSGGEPDTTNNRMELTAVLECLKKVLENKESNIDFEVYSDSAYVVNAINNKWLRSWKESGWKTKQGDKVKNADLWVEVDNTLRRITEEKKKLSIHKVKGHSGNVFNELCDKIARNEANNVCKR